MPQPIILVTAATGTQSSSLIRALSAQAQTTKTPITIHGTSRDPASSTATALVAANSHEHCTVKFFKTDLNDASTLTQAATGTTHAWVNVTPVLTDQNAESQHAANILSALRENASRTLRRIVYTSASSVRDPSVASNYHNLQPGMWMHTYYMSKYGIEESVIDLAKSLNISWTVLQPGTFLTNLLPPASTFMYPGLVRDKSSGSSSAQKHVVQTALVPEFIGAWLDPEAIGSFAAKSLLLEGTEYTDLYKNKRIPIGAWQMTLGQVVDSLNQYLSTPAAQESGRISAGVKVEMGYLTTAEAEQQKEMNPLVASQLFMNDNQGIFHDATLDGGKYGVEMGSLSGFWEREGKAGRVADALGY